MKSAFIELDVYPFDLQVRIASDGNVKIIDSEKFTMAEEVERNYFRPHGSAEVWFDEIIKQVHDAPLLD